MPIYAGLIGFGNVGTGVVEYFQRGNGEPYGVELKKVAVANTAKPRDVSFPYVTGDVDDILKDSDIKIVIELMGGQTPATEYILDALDRRKSVVTANKAVISRYAKELFGAARGRGVDLAFEASVAGGIPIIRTLRGYKGDRINSIVGILNGTTNYILSRMEDGMDFDAALRLAQQKGFAEAEHALDTGGYDARDKIAILASLAYNTQIKPEDIYCEGITEITPIDLDFAGKYEVEEGGKGYTIKLLASAVRYDNKLELHVYPALVRKEHPLAAVRDEFNAVYIEGELCGAQTYQGRGAGRNATTSAVITDVIRVADNIKNGITDELPSLDSRYDFVDIGNVERRGYVRVDLRHKPLSIARASTILGTHGFNIEDSIQRKAFMKTIDGEMVIPNIITSEPLPYRTVQDALEELARSDRVHGRPFYLRFED